MSLSIENLKFTIFGSGHDATLLDSGKGETQIFSHPFVPLNSTNYAGQYYFIVPDENGDPIDAVKDDIAHCTFTPAIGATFDTEGQTTVSVHYHREYIYAEGTIIVDKTVSQVIEVVDHGTVSSSQTRCDVYSDGYLFYHPSTVNTAISEAMYCNSATGATKLSSIPWRVTALGKYGIFANSTQLVDIDELQYADTSNVTEINELFHGALIQNLDPLAGWDTHNVTKIYRLAFGCPNLNDVSGLADWYVSNVTDISSILTFLPSLRNLHGLEKWDVRKVEVMNASFYTTGLESIDALADWKPERLYNIRYILAESPNLVSLEPLSGWHPVLYEIEYAFRNCPLLVNYNGVENFDTSHVSNFQRVFEKNIRVTDISAVAGWDVSNGSTFVEMFARNFWNDSISAVSGWTFKAGANLTDMFRDNHNVLTLDDATLDISAVSSAINMLFTLDMCYSSLLGCKVWFSGVSYYDYNNNVVTAWDEDHPITVLTKDASNASNWTVSGTGLSVFNNKWTDVPAWN